VGGKPEQRARAEIDRLLAAAGWTVQSVAEADGHVSRGVVTGEFPLKESLGVADYAHYIEGNAAGVIEMARAW